MVTFAQILQTHTSRLYNQTTSVKQRRHAVKNASVYARMFLYLYNIVLWAFLLNWLQSFYYCQPNENTELLSQTTFLWHNAPHFVLYIVFLESSKETETNKTRLLFSRFCPRVPFHKNRYKSRNNVQQVNKGVQWLFPLCTGTLRHNPHNKTKRTW